MLSSQSHPRRHFFCCVVSLGCLLRALIARCSRRRQCFSSVGSERGVPSDSQILVQVCSEMLMFSLLVQLISQFGLVFLDTLKYVKCVVMLCIVRSGRLLMCWPENGTLPLFGVQPVGLGKACVAGPMIQNAGSLCSSSSSSSCPLLKSSLSGSAFSTHSLTACTSFCDRCASVNVMSVSCG